MNPDVMAPGVAGFLAALDEVGADPCTETGLVIYTVVPLAGALAHRPVRTGVAEGEVAPWPLAPPHWIHLPTEVRFTATNEGDSPRSGWSSHSRDAPAWGLAPRPVAAWLAHVRGVLAEAK